MTDPVQQQVREQVEARVRREVLWQVEVQVRDQAEWQVGLETEVQVRWHVRDRVWRVCGQLRWQIQWRERL